MSNLVGWPHPGEARLTAFRDGELTAESARLVGRHLERCPACRGIVDRQREAAELILEVVPWLAGDDLGRELAAVRSVLAQAAIEAVSPGSAPEPAPAFSTEQLERLFGSRVTERLCRLNPETRAIASVTSDHLVSAFLGMKVGRVSLLR
ncbi:MAG: zf-HC2 domain-containing protein [Candidatus Solibacter usitatus]|nr:zf-HC2 domain-containing protein [Candidatus Solibacter usitatus]